MTFRVRGRLLILVGVVAALVVVASQRPGAQPVGADRIRRASAEPQNWLTYNGTY